ncbi:MAG: serine/threonine protein kinase, partial [Nannocystaceae bacterium]|nr:serine/threonine protein kinase [Nannocystaceae bacterium]
MLNAHDVFAERYRIQRELGRGGMGKVYLARDLELQRNVAIKVAAGRSAEVELGRLQHEAQTMAQLSHPNIVTVFEAAEFEGHVYLSMEFVPGGTVRDWVDVESHPWRKVVQLFIELGRALAAAHEAGVIHRDFKPENVLLGLDGTPKVADFGLARLSLEPINDSAEVETTSIVGTPAYMAPEQALGARATQRSDQFSFCVTLYEALVGRRPYGGRTLSGLLDAMEKGELEDPRGAMPNALWRVIRRGLLFDPDQRHTDMAELVYRLVEVERARGRRLRAGGLGLALVVAGGVGFASAAGPEPCLQEDIRQTVAA